MRAKKGFTFDPCHGCGQVPDHWEGRPKDSVCSNCKNTLKLARKFAEEQSSGNELVQVAIPAQSHWLPYLRQSSLQNQACKDVREAIWRLAISCSSPVVKGADFTKAQLLIPVPKNERTDWRPSWPEELRWMSESVASRFATLYMIVRQELDNSYEEGRERGQNLLGQLAAGDLSINDFNKMSLGER